MIAAPTIAPTFADYGIEIPPGRSGEVDTLCPKCSHTRRHNPRHRCLSVNTHTGVFLCHHCGWSGGLGTADTNGYGARLRRDERPRRQYAKPEPVPDDPDLPAHTLAWFADRGISEATVRRNRIDVADGAIRYPYLRDGETVNIKHRGRGKKFWMVKDAERLLYGLDDCPGTDDVIVVEGEMDKLAFEEAGYRRCLSVPDGAPAPDAANYAGKFDFLASTDVFERARRVYLATDADAPGQKLADELARRIGPEKCWRILWPEGFKDANEILMRFGPDELGWWVDEAKPWPVAGIVTVNDLAADIDALYDAGMPHGTPTGWWSVDRHYTVRPGLFTVVTGSPGAGKSHFLDALMVNLAVRHDWTFGICSPENQPLARHAAGMIATYRGEPFGDGPTPRMSRDQMQAARRWLNEHAAFVLPDEPTLEAVLERARVLTYRMGIRGLVVDPWNELDHSRPNGMTETEYVSQCLTKLRTFARRHDVHVWLVAHPTKLQKTADGVYPVPTPYDIAGSAHFYNKADSCISVHRDRANPGTPVELHVQKIRFAETGELGMVPLLYDPPTGRYREVPR